MTDVTLILLQIERGDPSAAEQLLPLVYDELRKLERISRSSSGRSAEFPGIHSRGIATCPCGNRSQVGKAFV